MRFRMVNVILVFALTQASVSAQSPQLMVPGEWEITLQNELPVATSPVTIVVCVSPERAAHPEPPKSKPGDDCQISGGLVGNAVSYISECARQKSKSTVNITYHGNRYDGVVELADPLGTLRQRISAKRLGPCANPAAAVQESGAGDQ